VKFVFDKIDLQNPAKKYLFCIKLVKEKYNCELPLLTLGDLHDYIIE
jgi:hypothetical protein